MNTPKVSYLMSVYNESQEVLKDAVDSVIQQHYDNIELVLVLDNPERSDLKANLEYYEHKYSFIQVIKNESNIGLAQSLNKGLAVATGAYIFRADADDICLPERTQKQIDYLEAHPKIAILGSSVDMIDEKNRFIKKKQAPPKSDNPIPTLQYKTLAYHPTWAVRHDVFEALDGYRNLPCSQDYDLLFRAAEEGYIIDNLSDTTVRYRMSTGRTSASKSFEQHLISKIIRKNSKKRLNSGKDFFDSNQAWNLFLNPNTKNKTNYNIFQARMIILADSYRKKKLLRLFANTLKVYINHPFLAYDITHRYLKSKK